ncbi:MAG: response regulator receiver modulated diguanylate cyclase [Frankiales bacterium]|nr:response regulator receiver modulated diguanylate cyclase [Frankiales bacterium]
MPTAAPVTVLVADDSAVVRSLVRVELEDAGYVVVEAVDGAEALRMVAEHAPSVLLLDVEMPVLDGFATIVALKSDPATADLPVVFLTGRSDTGDVVEALRLGAHDYLRKPPETAELLARVSAAAEVTGLRRELRRRTEELDQQARTDHLTGLHNRRHLEEHLDALVTGARRHRHPFSVLLVDVDHFKRVNDTAGHDTGDRVLAGVSRRMAAVVRTEDVLGRWGGEEFLLLCPFTDLEGAVVLAERLRAAVAAEPVEGLAVTVSIGGSVLIRPGDDDRGALLRAADAHLYRAKGAGRDRCEVAVLPV